MEDCVFIHLEKSFLKLMERHVSPVMEDVINKTPLVEELIKIEKNFHNGENISNILS